MMMVLPLLIIVLLPKVVNTNDPEMRKVKCYFSSVCSLFEFHWLHQLNKDVSSGTVMHKFLCNVSGHSFHSLLHRKWSSPWTCWTLTRSFQTSRSSWPSFSPAPRAPARQAAAARARGRLWRGGSTVPYPSPQISPQKHEFCHGSEIFKCHFPRLGLLYSFLYY